MYLVKKDGHESDCEDSSSGDELEKGLDVSHQTANGQGQKQAGSTAKPVKAQEQQKPHLPTSKGENDHF